MSSEPQKTRYELTVDLVKALAWPLFALLVLFSFWHPLHLAMNQLPDIVNRADTITIAGLSIKIDRNLQLQGQEPSAEVKRVLANMTPKGIGSLMELEISAYYPSSTPTEEMNTLRAENAELVGLGLFEEIPVQELGSNSTYGVKVTQLGKDTRKYLFAIISEFVQQLNQSRVTPTPCNE